MTPHKFSTASLVTGWLLILTQHEQLVEELAGTKGLQLDRHIRNLAVHLLDYLEDGTINPEVLKRAQRAHAAVGAFEGAKRHMSVFVLDAFALVAHAAKLPQLATFDAINALALAHEAPAEQGTLASRAERAIGTLTHLREHRAIMGDGGTFFVLSFIESAEGAETLRYETKEALIRESAELLRGARELAGETGAREAILNVIKGLMSKV